MALYRSGSFAKLTICAALAVIIPLVVSCSSSHLINDSEYLKGVEKSFMERKELASNRADSLFSVFSRPLSLRQKEALEFLYAYMPLSDLADYSGDFFLSQADMALRARAESPWGRAIPEQIFLHYVLPCRVNNENLDSFRIVYYDEIMGRVKNKGIIDAALEINHWCHEKVAYAPADIRTSAPMSTILSARGRCGEESTFTVAALRTAGIPARQVYTPRWAHTDDNHAWVEIWSGGRWYYMGACEPEPVIDRGWFTEPARRAMLVHTKSFGPSPEEKNVVVKQRNYTEINNLSKYAVTKDIYVKVTDTEGRPVPDAKVEYQLYNYAEFFPLAVVPADENGISRFSTGLGDLLIRASFKDAFNFRKISTPVTDTLLLVLDKRPGGSYDAELDLNVPAAPPPLPDPDPAMIAANKLRLDEENTIRQNYINSWMKPADAASLAISLHTDTSEVVEIFKRSMGNYREIRSFLEGIPDSLIKPALSMLEVLPDKDLRDTRASILSDHLINTYKQKRRTDIPGKMFVEYVLNPRVANEMLSGWRGYFRNNLPREISESGPADPQTIADYLEKNIRIDDDDNFYRTPITPEGVLRLKVSDTFSRSVCFVALCRSLGIPSRLEPGTNVPQFCVDSEWHDQFFRGQEKPPGSKSFIKLVTSGNGPEPEYYSRFTLAVFENGRYKTLEYDYEKKVSDFKKELPLSPGSYMLVTGNRLPSGRILSRLSFFDLTPGEHKNVVVRIPEDPVNENIGGSVDMNSVLRLIPDIYKDKPGITGKNLVLLWVDPEREPTKHIFSELPRLKQQFDTWGGYLIILTDPGCKWNGFSADELKLMPARLIFGHDTAVLQRSFKSSGVSGLKFPYVIVAGKKGNILYSSAGYRIGIGQDILRYVK